MKRFEIEVREYAPGYHTEMPVGAYFSPVANYPWDEYIPFYKIRTVEIPTPDGDTEYLDMWGQAHESMEKYVKILTDEDWFSMGYHPESGEWTYLPQILGWESESSSEELSKEFEIEREYSNFEIQAIEKALKGTRRFQ